MNEQEEDLTFTITAKKARDRKWDIEIQELTDCEGELIKGRTEHIGDIQEAGQDLIRLATGLEPREYTTNLRVDMSHTFGKKPRRA